MKILVPALFALLLGATVRGDVRTARTNDAVVFLEGDREILRYQAEPGPLPETLDPLFHRGGYLHPIRTPSGRVVTADFPADHPHHHGIWFAWTKTEFDNRTPDFWNMGQGTGRIDFAGIENRTSAAFRSRHKAVDLTSGKSVTVLEETWNVFALAVTLRRNIFDIEIVQKCATGKPLRLPRHHYGGLGFRGPDNWTGDDFEVLTSDGETDRIRANESRAKWIRISGPVEGESAFIAILCHPENVRAPQPLRVHPDEPFVCFAPTQLGEMEIAPGEELTARYRVVVSEEPLDAATLDTLWREYSLARPR